MYIGVLALVGLLIRLCLIVYGEWQDRTMAVKFTDVDYFVFNDAASYMTQGKSPYLRATYRYTPLLAWMLQPNIWFSSAFGKLLFIVLDVYTGIIIYNILSTSKGISANSARLCAAFWLFNPLPMTVSSRGNAESIMTCLVLLCLKLLQDRKVYIAAAVFSLTVHFKIYPVIYAIPIYLLLGKSYRQVKHTAGGLWENLCDILLPTKDRVAFMSVSGLILALLTLVFYYLYGWDFLHHTYLYHITRKDIRHNFSVYFYMLYQQSGADNSSLLALLSFLPQALILLVFSFKFYQEPALVFFLNTLAFVSFNKVCTSQYFLWYLCLLPLLFPYLTRISPSKAVFLVSLWFAGQGLWLLPAYYLEFQGVNTFLYIWVAGLAFFVINCYILYEVIHNYSVVPCIHVISRSQDVPHSVSECKSKSAPVYTSDQAVDGCLTSGKVSRNTRYQTRKRNKIK